MASSQPAQTPEYTLHTYFRSSCSGRIRLALNLKGLPYKPVYVNLAKHEHRGADYLALNPSGFVPLLSESSSNQGSGAITTLAQSMAILEYLEEAHPTLRPLLPPTTDLQGRAHVRALANVIACDTQPVTNMRILQRIAALGSSNADWAKELMAEGFAVYESMVAPQAGTFSYGDQITLADVCLVPAIYGAQRFGVDLEAFPTVMRIFANLSKEPAVLEAQWNHQADCPENLKG